MFADFDYDVILAKLQSGQIVLSSRSTDPIGADATFEIYLFVTLDRMI